jgi:type VI secretion system protein VasJ
MNTYLFSNLGKQPINEMSTAGSDVRNDPQYENIENEISKLSNPNTSNAVNWHFICDTAAELLANKGKDILVACYLTCGLLQTSSLAGLSEGLSILSDMLEIYWDSLYPPVQRARARRNALQFLIDHIQLNASGPVWSALVPQPPELIQTLLNNTRKIDAFIQNKDSDAPSMQPLISLFNSIPVIENASEIVDLKIATEEQGLKTASREIIIQQQLDPLSAAIESIDQVDPILEKISRILGNLSDLLLESNLSNPLGYRLARSATWLSIEQAPPAAQNKTLVPAPNIQLINALRGLQESRAHEDIVRFAETQLRQHPFWLDLNRICAEALSEMGAHNAEREITSATQHFSQRLPELIALSFSDGMPFADAETRSWLELNGNKTPEINEVKANNLQNSIHDSRAMALEGKLGEAADFIQKQIDHTTSPRDKLLMRLHLCELMFEQRPAGNLLPFAISIIAEIDRFHLTEWDPSLAIRGLKAAHHIMARDNEEINEANKLLARIIELDAGAAVRMII